MTWAEYWNTSTSTYVNARHRQVHYEVVARDLIACIPSPRARVLDYGCGDALSAHLVAEACAHLFLCDSSPSVRDRLAGRYPGRADISVLSTDQFLDLQDGTIDLIVANSVVQYMSTDELERFLEAARLKLAPRGQLVLADIIPPNVGPVTDASALLKFALANGFLVPAVLGLMKLFFSSYRHTRARFGLLQFDEKQIVAVLGQAGFRATRHHANFGHNPARMTFLASPIMAGTGSLSTMAG